MRNGQIARARRRMLLPVALPLAMALVLSACGGSSDGSSDGSDDADDSSADAPEEPSEPIRIALVSPLTGDAASYGLEVQEGINLAIEQINESGGIEGRPIELDEYDDKCSPTDGATAANAVVSRDYVAVVGQVCSVAVQAAMPILQQNEVPIIASSASSPALAEIGYEGFNRIVLADDVSVANAVRMAAEVFDYTRLAALYSADDYGQNLAQVVEGAADEFGIEMVAMEAYTPGQTNDYLPMLSNIAQTDAEAILLGGYDADMGVAVRQSSRAFSGQDIPFVSNNNVQTANFIELAEDAAEGIFISTIYDPSKTTDGNPEFVELFREAYDKDPGTQGALGWDAIQVLRAAIENNGGETTDLFEAIRTVEVTGVTGPVRFQDTGDRVADAPTVLTVSDGAWVFDTERTEQMASQ